MSLGLHHLLPAFPRFHTRAARSLTARPVADVVTRIVVPLVLAWPVLGQAQIRIGELNSYKSQPAFLEPYRKGWEL